MYAGVILSVVCVVRNKEGVPRVCGGDPKANRVNEHDGKVFPVYAGVILLDV